jgi:hypothetical protein
MLYGVECSSFPKGTRTDVPRMLKTLEVRNCKQWRKWLARNHESELEVWLGGTMKKINDGSGDSGVACECASGATAHCARHAGFLDRPGDACVQSRMQEYVRIPQVNHGLHP